MVVIAQAILIILTLLYSVVGVFIYPEEFMIILDYIVENGPQAFMDWLHGLM